MAENEFVVPVANYHRFTATGCTQCSGDWFRCLPIACHESRGCDLSQYIGIEQNGAVGGTFAGFSHRIGLDIKKVDVFAILGSILLNIAYLSTTITEITTPIWPKTTQHLGVVRKIFCIFHLI
jgi:hypothetical protein